MIIPLILQTTTLLNSQSLCVMSKDVQDATPRFFIAQVQNANDEGFQDWRAKGFTKQEHAIEELAYHQIWRKFSLFIEEKDLLRYSDQTLLNRMILSLDGFRYHDNPYEDTRTVIATRDVFGYSNKGRDLKDFDVDDNVKLSLNLDYSKIYFPFIRFRQKTSSHEEMAFRIRVQADLEFMGERMGNPNFAKSAIFI